MTYGIYFLFSLLLTLVVELSVLFLVVRYLLKIKIPVKEILYWGILVNLFSLPYLWFVFPLFIWSRYYILIGEILVVLIESVIFLRVFRINLKKALFLSFLTNIASYFLGIVVLKWNRIIVLRMIKYRRIRSENIFLTTDVLVVWFLAL